VLVVPQGLRVEIKESKKEEEEEEEEEERLSTLISRHFY
jgi:hypothetical protein